MDAVMALRVLKKDPLTYEMVLKKILISMKMIYF